jgi:hypothetical protein
MNEFGEMEEWEKRRIVEICNVVDNYSKYLYKESIQTQNEDELQGMISLLLNELLSLLNLNKVDNLVPFVEFIPIEFKTKFTEKQLNDKFFNSSVSDKLRKYLVDYDYIHEDDEISEKTILLILKSLDSQLKIQMDKYLDLIERYQDLKNEHTFNLKTEKHYRIKDNYSKLKPGKYVYFVYDGCGIKIGVSKHPIKRLKKIQTDNSGKCELLWFFKGDEKTESILQTLFKDHKTESKNEWFEFTEPIRDFIYHRYVLIPEIELEDLEKQARGL